MESLSRKDTLYLSRGADMRKLLALLFAASVAGAAQAQIKCWTNAAGKRECGDTPPPGAKVSTVRGTAPAGPAPAPAEKDAAAKDAKKGPLTPAEQEQEFRKRQLEAQKTREKEEQERKDAEVKRQNCEQARAALRTLESGQRIARADERGERYFLDETQIAAEIARARRAVQQSCN
jgi:hypothetical protein